MVVAVSLSKRQKNTDRSMLLKPGSLGGAGGARFALDKHRLRAQERSLGIERYDGRTAIDPNLKVRLEYLIPCRDVVQRVSSGSVVRAGPPTCDCFFSTCRALAAELLGDESSSDSVATYREARRFDLFAGICGLPRKGWLIRSMSVFDCSGKVGRSLA